MVRGEGDSLRMAEPVPSDREVLITAFRRNATNAPIILDFG